MSHPGHLQGPWPTGCPLPPEDPAKLQGPEIGDYMLYRDRTVVRVIERSYVWSPGECRADGGYRHYNWSVIEQGPSRFQAVVVNDSDLSPLPTDPWSGKPRPVHLVYAIRP